MKNINNMMKIENYMNLVYIYIYMYYDNKYPNSYKDVIKKID